MREKNAWRLFEATGTPQAYMIFAREREKSALKKREDRADIR